MEAPKMTYYARVIDNVTNKEILNFTSMSKSNAWYYGQCNGLEGGESQYIVEFDIWNNEPAFAANTYDSGCADATNCRLTVWPDVKLEKNFNNPLFNLTNENSESIPFIYARCTTMGYGEFTGIKYGDKMLTGIVGNKQPTSGAIKGSADHAFVQTKIKLPPNTNLSTQRYSFVFAFYYDFE